MKKPRVNVALKPNLKRLFGGAETALKMPADPSKSNYRYFIGKEA
jgi:hypothetical protein